MIRYVFNKIFFFILFSSNMQKWSGQYVPTSGIPAKIFLKIAITFKIPIEFSLTCLIITNLFSIFYFEYYIISMQIMEIYKSV